MSSNLDFGRKFRNFVSIAYLFCLTGSATELKMVTKPNAPVMIGTSVVMKCETDGSKFGSPGSIVWYKNGQAMSSRSYSSSTRQASEGGTIYTSQVTFTVAKTENQAKYECKINDQASFKKDATISVLCK
jgi:hypothetical protein